MAREVLSNGVINPDKYQADWYADLSNNWNLLDNLIGSAISSSEVDSKIATAIQELMIRTFQIVAELPVTGTEGVMYLVSIPDTSKYTAYVWENNAYRELGVIQMTITVDDELSTTSENPAQNKVITNALNNKAPISHTHSASDITSGLSSVATSGSYNDLSNKPTIPTVNNATLTIQKNGTNVQTFTANQSTNATANITVPTKTSDLTNDSGFITSDDTKIPLSGSNAISGDLIPSTTNTVNLGSSNYYWNNGYINNLYTKVCGVTAPYLACVPIDYTLDTIPDEKKQGFIDLFTDVNGNPDFRIHDCIYSSGNKDIYFYTYSIKADTNALILSQALSDNLLSVSTLYGDLGLSQTRWRNLFLVNAPNVSSDERVKQQIKSVDDDLIEIWENIKPKQYKLNSSVERKGENARTHIGYIVQDIQKACEEKGIDPTKYSMFCHDEWEEQEEKKDENGQVIEPYRAKGDLYSLRYEEALVVECAYLRKKLKELTVRIEQLEKGNNVK